MYIERVCNGSPVVGQMREMECLQCLVLPGLRLVDQTAPTVPTADVPGPVQTSGAHVETWRGIFALKCPDKLSP